MTAIDRFTLDAALRALAGTEDPGYAVLLEHGTLELGFYKPVGVDLQQPHDRDEVYVIQQGTGRFMLQDVRRPFEPGEVLFVPAGAVHRFEDFSEDFAAWVIFYGPAGGER